MGQTDKTRYDQVRLVVARQFIRYLLPTMSVLILLMAASIYSTHGLEQWQRFLPLICVALGCVTSALAWRRGREAVAAYALVLSLGLATTIGVLFNSVVGPAYWANLLILILFVTLTGFRGGLLYVGWIALSGGAWFVLDAYGLTSGLKHASPALTYMLVCIFSLMGLAFVTAPQRLLQQALLQSQERLERLERSELAFEAVFEQAAVLLALLRPDGAILQLNRAARGAVALSGGWEEILGLSLLEAPWWLEEHRAQLEALLPRVASDQAQQCELRFPTSQKGRWRTYHLVLSAHTHEDGQIQYILAQATEVTDQIRARERLHHSQRMEALGYLSGGIAHDFNNMLGAIQAATTLMRMEPGMVDTPQRAELVEMAEDATARAASLTQQLLAFGRRDRIQVKDLDLHKLLQEIHHLLERTLGKGIQIKLELDAPPLVVHGDRHALEHALLNLALNARDAMQGQGTLTLALRHQAQPSMAVLDVVDSGPGVPEALMERIFEPFFTTKPSGQGTGLGLAAVHGTLHAHQGDIELLPRPEGGAHFQLKLPCRPGLLQADQAPDSQAQAPPALTGRVLLVDDETLLRQGTHRLLENAGLQVFGASDARMALALLEKAEEPFSLALVDVVMPGMSGLELTRLLHRRYPQLPVVLMSGFVDQDISGELPQERAYTLLRKPFSRHQLLHTLAPWLEAQAQG